MSFRRRIALLAGGAVAVAILLASVAAYLAIDRELRAQVDDNLRTRADQYAEISRRSQGRFPPSDLTRDIPRPSHGNLLILTQLVNVNGTVLPTGGSAPFPVEQRVRDVAAGRRGAYNQTVRVDSEQVRMRVAPLANGYAVQVGRSLSEVYATLDRIRLILLLVACGGIAVAALLGRVVAGRAIEPLSRLTRTAEQVAETRDLARRIDAGGTDEIGRLATRFNQMLEALETTMGALATSVRSQRQLVADASHELRTPVTSLRTNLEILQANPDLAPNRRAELIDNAQAQTGELTALMNDLIELARGDGPTDEREPVRLDELVEDALERAIRHAPGQRFDVELVDATVLAPPSRLARAINNLLDNAITWNAPGAPIHINLRGGELTVRDHGPGFDPTELEHVFDRFFRGARSRRHSGSGLGLAIARHVAETCGGSVAAHNAPGGGATLTIRLPLDNSYDDVAAPEQQRTQHGGDDAVDPQHHDRVSVGDLRPTATGDRPQQRRR
jgi:two-component system, OmpR family, sensor histidine kinase MprB